MNSDYNHHMRQLDEHRKEQIDAIGRAYDFTHHSEVVKPCRPAPPTPKWVLELEERTRNWPLDLAREEMEYEFKKRGLTY